MAKLTTPVATQGRQWRLSMIPAISANPTAN